MMYDRNQPAATWLADLLLKPRPLPGLGRETRTQQLRVDRQESPAADRHRPVVRADDVQPPPVPPGIPRVAPGGAGPGVVADVMIAGNRLPGHRQPVELLPPVVQIP